MWLTIAILIFSMGKCLSQGLFKIDRTLPDSLFKKSYRNKLSLSTGFQLNNATFILANPNGGPRVMLSPEISMQQFLKMEFKQITLRYSFTLFPIDDIVDQPNHYRQEYGASFGIKQFNFDLSLQNARGYFVKNSKDFPSNIPNSGSIIQLPNLKTKVIGIQSSYNSNKQFSIENLLSGKELQIRNAYSFIPGAAIYYIHFFQENPTELAGAISDDYLVDFNINLPVAATIAFAKKWYVSGIAGPMFGMGFYNTQSYDANLQKVSKKQTEFTNGYYLKAGVGFASNKWFAGLSAYNQRYGSGSGVDREARFFYGASLYVGYRIRAPKVLKQTSDILPLNDEYIKKHKL